MRRLGFVGGLCIVLFISTLAVFMAASARADDLSVTVNLFDPVTQTSKDAFSPGEEVGYKIQASFPTSVIDKEATVTLDASFKVGAISVPYNLSTTFHGPITDPTGEPLDTTSPRVWSGTFKIPRNAPASKLTLQATLVVDGVNQKVTVIKTLSVKK